MMIRTVFAMAATAIVFAAVSGTSQAAPIAPIAAGVQAGAGNFTQVYYYGYRRPYYRHYGRCYWRYGYRHCW